LFKGHNNINIKKINAETDSYWETLGVKIERIGKTQASKKIMSIYNGVFVNDENQGFSISKEWEASNSLEININHTPLNSPQPDKTLLNFNLDEGSFSISTRDLIAEKAIYIPHAKLFVTLSSQPISLENYIVQAKLKKCFLEQAREMPDQTLEQALKITRDPIHNQGPIMLSLACDNRKFIVTAHGSIIFQDCEITLCL
jgi:hypothetical protein